MEESVTFSRRCFKEFLNGGGGEVGVFMGKDWFGIYGARFQAVDKMSLHPYDPESKQ